MHPAQIAEMLKDLSDQQLAGELQRPSGSVPQYMALAELSRRQRLRSSPQPQGPAPQQTIAQQLIAQIPPQPMPPMQRPVQRFQEGGLVEEDPYDLETLLGSGLPPPSMSQWIEDYRKVFPQQDYYADVRKGLSALEEQLSQRKGKAGKEALLQAGLAMLASRSPDFLRAAGQGGLAGLEGYQQSRNQNMAMENALLNQREGLATQEQGFREREPINAYNMGMLGLQRQAMADRAQQLKRQSIIAMANAGARVEPEDVPVQSGYNVLPGGAQGRRLVAPGLELKNELAIKKEAAGRNPPQPRNFNTEQRVAEINVMLASPDLTPEARARLEQEKAMHIQSYTAMRPRTPITPQVNPISQHRERVRQLADRVVAESRAGGGKNLDDAISNVENFYAGDPDLGDPQIKAEVIAEIERRKPRGTSRAGILDRHLSGQSAPASPAAQAPQGKPLTQDKAIEYLNKAGGDKDKARAMARADGYTF